MNRLILEFDEWRDNCLSEASPSEVVECPDCDGEGTTIEDCCCCGHETEELCIACEGEGSNKFGNLCTNDKRKVFGYSKYQDDAIKAISDYSAWTGKDKFQLIVNNGFTVLCSINKRCESIRKFKLSGFKFRTN